MDPSQMLEALQTLLRQTQEEAEKRQDEKRRQEAEAAERRQKEERRQEREEAEERQKALMLETEAVSYTHLDVYKRQSMFLHLLLFLYQRFDVTCFTLTFLYLSSFKFQH